VALKEIQSVSVGFEDATGYGYIFEQAPHWTYFPNRVDANFPTEQVHETINWLVEGDYSPVIKFTYFNGTQHSLLYQDDKVHVSSITVLEQERYNKLTLCTTIALFLFAVLESVVLVRKLIQSSFEEKEGRRRNRHNTNYWIQNKKRKHIRAKKHK
jgi:hypothetical protein